jgi:serine/threonine protein kinase
MVLRKRECMAVSGQERLLMGKASGKTALAVTPERFGRYVLLDRIGEGGMAEVFRAVMPGAEGFRRTFVIKKILDRLSQSSAFVEMFVHEARIGALLHHPNIVQVYDFGSVDGCYFLAMEYVRGHDVLAIIRRLRELRRPFPVAVAAHIAHAVANCLAYAHALTGPDGQSLGIVHRDVTPSNVMCLREGGVKLLDFGIASAVSEFAVEKTEQSTFKGKLAYVAPERLRNDMVDGRSDLYSLGVMLWEMLTCRRLFHAHGEADTLHKILEMAVPPPSQQRPDIPPSLDAIVLRMLERDPDNRYQTGMPLADDLEDVLRECNFRSNMLPALLVDLFGCGHRSSQFALSCLTPELLAEAADSGSQPAEIPLVSSSSVTLLRRPRLRWLAACSFVAASTFAWGWHAGWFSGRKAAPHVVSAQAPVAMPTAAPAAPPATVASPIPAADPVASAGPVVSATPSARTNPGSTGATKRASRAPGRATSNAIVNGKSIDPFAESAKRGL